MPPWYAITGPADSRQEWWQRYEAMLRRRPGLVQLRLRWESVRDPETFMAAAVKRGQQLGNRVVVNAAAELAGDSGADGIHLDSLSLMAADRRPVSRAMLLGASCHDASELEQAALIGADFACLSPVLPTRSHPGRTPLGLDGFARLLRDCPVPVYALGGLDQAALAEVRAAGGQGIAGISAFWGD